MNIDTSNQFVLYALISVAVWFPIAAVVKVFNMFKDKACDKTIDYVLLFLYVIVSLAIYIFIFATKTRIIIGGTMLLLMFMLFFFSLAKNPFRRK